MKDNTGCYPWIERSSWCNGNFISELVYEEDNIILKEKYIRIISKHFEDDKSLVSVVGNKSYKMGKEFNAGISYYNGQLKDLPNYVDWLIMKLGIMRSGIGERGNVGFSMLETYGGDYETNLAFAIPNNKDREKHGEIKIPEDFEKITYGQFEDLTLD
jgi:hypothetical protein